MSGVAYLVVKSYAYESPELIAVWRDEQAALAHKESIEVEWRQEGKMSRAKAGAPPLVIEPLSPYQVWTIPFEPALLKVARA